MATPTLDSITKLFDIKPKSQDFEDEEAYEDLKSSDTFSSDIEEVKDIIKEQNPDGEESSDDSETVVTVEPEAVLEVAPEAPEAPALVVTNFTATPEAEEAEASVRPPVSSPEPEMETEADGLFIKSDIKLDDWNLESPSPKFDSFYGEKRRILNELMSYGGRKNFKRYVKELVAAKVDVSISLYDLPGIHAKMQEVQGWRNRVKEIQMDCRYLKCEKAVELLIGLLARVEYAKPAQKQAGVVYEHLGDLELYCSELKDIYRSAEMIDKNLDSAYDCLSRQLTLAMPQKDRVIYESLPQNPAAPQPQSPPAATEVYDEPVVEIKVKAIPKELSGFDELLEIEEDAVPTEADTKPTQVVNLENAAKKTGWDGLL